MSYWLYFFIILLSGVELKPNEISVNEQDSAAIRIWIWKSSLKNQFLKTLQNSQESACGAVSFLIKLRV